MSVILKLESNQTTTQLQPPLQSETRALVCKWLWWTLTHKEAHLLNKAASNLCKIEGLVRRTTEEWLSLWTSWMKMATALQCLQLISCRFLTARRQLHCKEHTSSGRPDLQLLSLHSKLRTRCLSRTSSKRISLKFLKLMASQIRWNIRWSH